MLRAIPGGRRRISECWSPGKTIPLIGREATPAENGVTFMTHHFRTLKDLLDTATKVVEASEILFPHVAKQDLKASILLYLLKNSTIEQV